MNTQHGDVGEIFYFGYALNNASLSGQDGLSDSFLVREGGAAAGAAPVLSGSATLLTNSNYPPGCYEVAVAASASNGFTAGKTYHVFATAAVDSSTNPTGMIGTIKLTALATKANQGAIKAVTDLLTFDSSNQLVVTGDWAVAGDEMDLVNGAITAAKIAAAALNGKGNWNTVTPLDAAGVRTAVGLAAASLDADISTLAGNQTTINNNVLAVKSVTDLLTFTSSNELVVTGNWNTVTPLDAAGIRAAVGLSGASLDSDIAGLGAAQVTINNNVLTINAKIGTPATDVSTDIANINSSDIAKNTAGRLPFFMKLSSDHVSLPAAGKTVTAYRRLDAGSWEAVAGSITEEHPGFYFDYDAADCNCDTGVFRFEAPGCDVTIFPFKTRQL